MRDFLSALEALRPGMVAVVGVPYDEHSSFQRGAALAPACIRQALHSGAANRCAESGLDLGAERRLCDVGDLELAGGAATLAQIETGIQAVLERGARVLALGGDHAITYPILRAYARKHRNLSILQLDAHPDLYDEYEGDRLSHACPFARIMEEGLATRLVQVGIRAATPHQREQAQRFGVETVEMRAWSPERALDLAGPLYLSLDLDVLDPAFAPGVSHPEPGGLTTRDVLRLIQGLRAPLVGADIVEFNPTCEPVGPTQRGPGLTALVAAKLLKEIAARMLTEGTSCIYPS